jgi:hypothetical protein
MQFPRVNLVVWTTWKRQQLMLKLTSCLRQHKVSRTCCTMSKLQHPRVWRTNADKQSYSVLLRNTVISTLSTFRFYATLCKIFVTNSGNKTWHFNIIDPKPTGQDPEPFITKADQEESFKWTTRIRGLCEVSNNNGVELVQFYTSKIWIWNTKFSVYYKNKHCWNYNDGMTIRLIIF